MPRRVVVAGCGSGGADVGDLLARHARRLRDEGVEVIWLGEGVAADQLAAVAVAEDADAIAVAVSASDLTDDLTSELARRDAEDITVEQVQAQLTSE